MANKEETVDESGLAAKDPNIDKTESVKPAWLKDNKQELELRVILRQEFEQLFEIWKTKELSVLKEEQDVIIKKGLEELYVKYKEEQKPPTTEEIAALLNQEYESFPVKVQVEDSTDDTTGEAKYSTELFTIRELPQTAELKFYDILQNKILTKTSELQAFTQESIDMPFEQKVKSILSVGGEAFGLMAETVLIVLNPFGKRKVKGKEIDRDWIQNNISSNRQWSIVEAQLKVNRVKDFFSRISASGQQTQMMMTGVNFQQLQRLAR
jgi:hypothetical protein